MDPSAVPRSGGDDLADCFHFFGISSLLMCGAALAHIGGTMAHRCRNYRRDYYTLDVEAGMADLRATIRVAEELMELFLDVRDRGGLHPVILVLAERCRELLVDNNEPADVRLDQLIRLRSQVEHAVAYRQVFRVRRT